MSVRRQLIVKSEKGILRADEPGLSSGSWLPTLELAVPRTVRDLVRDLTKAGFQEVKGGKGSHRKFLHRRFPGAVTLSGPDGADAKPYQEKQVTQALASVEE